MNERDIFAQARELSSADTRAAFLNQACGGDAQLKARVESLLAEAGQLGDFLESPPAEVERTEVMPPSEGPGVSIGNYKLMEQLGQGGMGTVYVALQQQPVKRKVALKIIKPGMEGVVRKWNTKTGKRVASYLEHESGGWTVDRSRAGRLIASLGDRDVVVWNADTAKIVMHRSFSSYWFGRALAWGCRQSASADEADAGSGRHREPASNLNIRARSCELRRFTPGAMKASRS